jgi:NAD(P)-dependent dehydrogenase (short-subunit alcohol dehydrogenase family)
MDERVAVITGAAREGSIGRAIARRLLADGMRVVVSDIQRPLDTHPDYEVAPRTALEEAEADLSPLGEVRTFPCDVRKADEVEALVEFAKTSFGGLDVMVNNAGLGVGLTPVVELQESDWQLNLDVMATGVFLCSRAAARVMVDQGRGGRIITIASQAGKTGMPLLAAYCAAKFAALGFTQALAHELGPHGITVNAVCPGTVDTPLLAVRGGVYDAYAAARGQSVEEYRRRLVRQIPLRRFAEPEDIAAAVRFLASEDAAYVTGESVNVTGGQEMH